MRKVFPVAVARRAPATMNYIAVIPTFRWPSARARGDTPTMVQPDDSARILGIGGGGTKTTWALLTREGKVIARGEAGPGNTLLLSDASLAKLLREIRAKAGAKIDACFPAFAGCRQSTEKKRVEKIIRKTWPSAATVRVMEDTRSVLAAAFGDGPGIVRIAGTGSNVAAQISANAPLETFGGWGHLFSDEGSAYDIARL